MLSARYGFLTGNFGDDIDVEATALRYEQAIQAALEPGCEVEVRSQEAQGSLPHGLKPAVFTAAGGWHDNQGWTGEPGDPERAAAAQAFDTMLMTVEKVEPVYA